jgi:hypothetical protein
VPILVGVNAASLNYHGDRAGMRWTKCRGSSANIEPSNWPEGFPRQAIFVEFAHPILRSM